VSGAALRFALPSTLGADVEARVRQLREHLGRALGLTAEVVVPGSYEQLARELLAGRVDAAWAPPFVCARVEAMGVRVLVRGVRQGASTYRAALLCRQDANVTLETLSGTTAAWADRDSVGGYLLPMAFLREHGHEAARTFFKQDFVGSYRRALEAVLDGRADVTSVFAPAARGGQGEATGLDEIWPEKAGAFRVLAFTAEAPNDGVAVSMSAPAPLVTQLEQAFLSLHQTPEGARVLGEAFHAERFEVAPRLGYRALYRVALASL
jgi:phosphonate transport system substrate-binding protein